MPLTLYHASPSRSSVVLWMLEELGEPYDLKLLDLQKGEQKSPEFLAINPMGKVPALKAGDILITEVAAICTWLADAYPQAKLAPPIGDSRRAAYLRWMFYGPSCLEPAVFSKAFPPAQPAPLGAAGWGSFDTVMDVWPRALVPGRTFSGISSRPLTSSSVRGFAGAWDLGSSRRALSSSAMSICWTNARRAAARARKTRGFGRRPLDSLAAGKPLPHPCNTSDKNITDASPRV